MPSIPKGGIAKYLRFINGKSTHVIHSYEGDHTSHSVLKHGEGRSHEEF